MSPPPPLPPPPPPLIGTLDSPQTDADTAGVGSGGGGSISLSPSILIIAAILAFVFVASASIHLLLRFLSRPSSPSSRAVHHRSSSSSSSSGERAAIASAAAAALELSEKEKSALIESLPLFTIASSLAGLPKSSLDCAVCLSPFQPDAELRLLPACRHAFHAQCIDTWLRSTPSCPLCRASIALPHPPILETPRSGSFRIEIGSVSRRRTSPEDNSATATPTSGNTLPPLPPPPRPPPPPPLPHLRTYSLGSFDYFVEEELEAVVPRNHKEKKPAEVRAPSTVTVGGAPPEPGEDVAEAAGGAGRGWLKDYVDRLTSSASSSFNSLRFSGRWSGRGSYRFDGGGAPDSWWWDLEGNQQQQREGEEGGYYTLYRWLVGI
ncbi:E3 ubiquitin-protein ligase ATL4-like [Typha angustifolia]|uniref:E3 ubiquitin-protein ligase ATL4-like n=1 Tax=Typha angustifolia TaxID=59011 RepID=UPI003C2EFFC3